VLGSKGKLIVQSGPDLWSQGLLAERPLSISGLSGMSMQLKWCLFKKAPIPFLRPYKPLFLYNFRLTKPRILHWSRSCVMVCKS
jgi:hypothetical protein